MINPSSIPSERATTRTASPGPVYDRPFADTAHGSIAGDGIGVGKLGPAIVLTNGSDPDEHGQLFKLLDFFGLSWRTESVMNLHLQRERLSGARLFASGATLPELFGGIRSNPDLLASVHSIFVYAVANEATLDALEELSLKLQPEADVSRVEVARNHAVSGMMAGLRLTATKATAVRTFPMAEKRAGITPIVSTNIGVVFQEVSYRGIRLFVFTADKLVDLDAELFRGVFDIREHAIAALPIVLYLQWAFAGIGWRAPEANACFVLDDPLLKRRYGFVNYRRLLELMRQQNFATTIAFIPWNWDRSSPETVALFLNNPQRYSLSVHGCNHTAAEFSNGDKDYLLQKSQRALRLMTLHEQKTGIHHDCVMVFPHGAFNEAAMEAIKRTNFFASSSNETLAKGGDSSPVRIGEFWGIAVMRYSQHALFTRRSLQDGIENIAFDLLLGKAACIVIHHEECDDDCRQVIDFAQQMNGLPTGLHWCGLGDALRRSCRQRQISPDIFEMEMYGSELLLENRRRTPIGFDVSRLESEPQLIQSVTAGSQLLEWLVCDERIAFSLHVAPGERVLIKLRYQPLQAPEPVAEPFTVRTRTLLRRYLCELRDNYLITGKVKLSNLAGRRG